MRHLAAYLLAALNADGSAPTPAAIKSILGSVGVEADDTQLDVLFKRFSGMNIENALREGKLSFIACCGSLWTLFEETWHFIVPLF